MKTVLHDRRAAPGAGSAARIFAHIPGMPRIMLDAEGRGGASGDPVDFKTLVAEFKRAGDDVKKVAETAIAETKNLGKMTEETKATADKLLTDFNESKKELDARLAELERKGARRGGHADDAPRTLGEIVTEHPDVKSRLLAGTKKGSVGIEVETKTILSASGTWGSTASVTNSLVVPDPRADQNRLVPHGARPVRQRWARSCSDCRYGLRRGLAVVQCGWRCRPEPNGRASPCAFSDAFVLTPDGAKASLARLIATGDLVSLQRGLAPGNVVTSTTQVRCRFIRASQEELVGSTSEDDRWCVLSADEVAASGFPLPLAKNDRLVFDGERRLVVQDIDDTTRRIGGVLIGYQLRVTGR